MMNLNANTIIVTTATLQDSDKPTEIQQATLDVLLSNFLDDWTMCITTSLQDFCQCHRRCNTRHSLSRPILALRAIPVRPRLPSYPTRHPSCNAAVWKKLSAGLWPTTMPQSLAYQHQLLAEKLTRVTLPLGAHPSRQM